MAAACRKKMRRATLVISRPSGLFVLANRNMPAGLAKSPAPAMLSHLRAFSGQIPARRLGSFMSSGWFYGLWVVRLVGTLLLTAFNLLPLYGVWAWNWDPFQLLILYWLETVVVAASSLA